MLKLALIGCGEHSEGSHAAPLARYAAEHPGEIFLAAACDLNLERAEEFCRSFGFARAYRDYDQMLAEEDIGACVSVMPVGLIAAVGIKLLERGIPCVIEKPLGMSLAEVEGLAQVARETGTPHMVSVNRRFMPFLSRARAWAREQGELQYVRATMVRHNRNEPDFIWSTAVHGLDSLRHIAGEIKEYSVHVRRDAALSTLWYLITISFESGAVGYLEICPTAGFIEESYELFGEGFRARVVAGSGPQRTLKCWRGGRIDVEDNSSEDEPEHLRNGSYGEVRGFVQALQTGTRPAPSIEDILPSVRICLRIAQSVARHTDGS